MPLIKMVLAVAYYHELRYGSKVKTEVLRWMGEEAGQILELQFCYFWPFNIPV